MTHNNTSMTFYRKGPAMPRPSPLVLVATFVPTKREIKLPSHVSRRFLQEVNRCVDF
ncbi:UNVERIFIED_CONTAM: hypothetical protein FKN15_038692 [Acipenser sinensis]